MESRNYLIVGGSKGIGASLAEYLSFDNDVYYIARSEGNTAIEATYISCDVSHEALPLDQLPDTLHGLAFMPGTIRLKPFRSLKPEEITEDFQRNVLDAASVLKQCYRALKKAGNASVVLFSTVAVQQGMPFHASVAMAKGAIEGLGRSLAAEWAPDIRVNVIAPSITDTPLAAPILSSDERKEKSALRHPLKKIGQPEDIARTAEFLLSEKSSWISGQILGVDGGLSTLRV